MVTELKKFLEDTNLDDVDITNMDEMQKLLEKIILNMRGAEEPAVPEPLEADDDKDLIKAMTNFGGKHTSRHGTTRTKRLSRAGPRSSPCTCRTRNILKKIQSLSNDAALEDEKKVNTLLKSIGINQMIAEELQESLYDQLVQYTEGELLDDVQIAGPCLSFNKYRKTYHAGKKKTAENTHRARNRVSRPAIAENMDVLDEKFKKWKKDIAYLKDIDANEYCDNGTISILFDFAPTRSTKKSR